MKCIGSIYECLFRLRNAMSLIKFIYSFSPLYTNLCTTKISTSLSTTASSFCITSFFYILARCQILHETGKIRENTFLSIPLTRKAPLRSVFIINRGLFHLTLLISSSPSPGVLYQARSASPLLHFPPLPIINSSDGSPGRFRLTFFTVGCKFTVLKPSLRFVFRSVRDLSSF